MLDKLIRCCLGVRDNLFPESFKEKDITDCF